MKININKFRIQYLLIAILQLVVLTSCSLFVVERHKGVFLYQAEIRFQTNDEKLYFRPTYDDQISLYFYEDNSSIFKKASFFEEDDNYSYTYSISNSNKIFVCLNTSDNFYSTQIRVYDKDLVLLKKVYLGQNYRIRSMACTETFLYWCVNDTPQGDNSLWRFDFINEEKRLLIGKMDNKGSYADEDVELFYYGNQIVKRTEKTLLTTGYENNTALRICGDFEIALSNKEFYVSKNGERITLDNNWGFNFFYEKAYLIDDKLLFATYRYKKSKECLMPKDVGRCVCGFQESYLFSFDLNSNSLTLLSNYPAGAFLIDYDLGGSDYYFDGSLYVQNEFSKKSQVKIKPGAKHKYDMLNYDLDFNVDVEKEYYFFSTGGEIYGI